MMHHHSHDSAPAVAALNTATAAQGIWTCPMHPEVRQVGPGICPDCGMGLEPASIQVDDGPNPELLDMQRRFWWSTALTLPLVLLAMAPMLGLWKLTGGRLIASDASQMLLAGLVVFGSGWPLLERGWNSVRTLRLNMFTLIALGVSVAFVFSVVVFVLTLFAESSAGLLTERGVYFESAAVIVTLVLLGQVLELRARARTTTDLRELLAMAPDRANRLTEGNVVEVAAADLQVDDVIRVAAGERLPADGIVVEGRSAIDDRWLTGESEQRLAEPGMPVVGGALLHDGALDVRVTRVASERTLEQLVQLVLEAQRNPTPLQRLADRISAWFVPSVTLIAMLTLAAWALFGGDEGWLIGLVGAVSVLLIACPCALGLATPMATLVAGSLAAQRGLAVRDAAVLENVSRVGLAIFDKTGTLTTGQLTVQDVTWLGPESGRPDILHAIAALESHSQHPMAQSLLEWTKAQGASTALPPVEDIRVEPGLGIQGVVDGRRLRIGAARWIDPGFAADVVVEAEGQVVATFRLTDPLRPEAKAVVEKLKEAGVTVILASGDRKSNAQHVAESVGLVDSWHGEMSPEDKQGLIEQCRTELTPQRPYVMMIGDGLNDSLALTTADIGVVMASGASLSQQTAHVSLTRNRLSDLLELVRLGSATRRKIWQNLGLAFGYNTLAIPIAAGILYPAADLLLSPMIAAAAMSLSSVTVIGNALRLKLSFRTTR